MADLPSGTVTLLFTDIEGSTGLVRQLGGRWAGVLAEHRELLRRSTREAGGREVDCRADDFMGVFEQPKEALAAAVATQTAFAAHSWPEGLRGPRPDRDPHRRAGGRRRRLPRPRDPPRRPDRARRSRWPGPPLRGERRARRRRGRQPNASRSREASACGPGPA